MIDWLALSRSGENLWYSLCVNWIRVSVISYFKLSWWTFKFKENVLFSLEVMKNVSIFMAKNVWCVLKFSLFIQFLDGLLEIGVLSTGPVYQLVWNSFGRRQTRSLWVWNWVAGAEIIAGLPASGRWRNYLGLGHLYYLMQNVLNFWFQVVLRHKGTVCFSCSFQFETSTSFGKVVKGEKMESGSMCRHGNRPHMLICYLCGREYGSRRLAMSLTWVWQK